MECLTVTNKNSETAPVAEEDQKSKNSDSAENFQHFIYELFEKNGILNDLRAYLRGHIVEVLKSSQTGDPPTCQKHFTHRLELENQALNMLVTEYLLRYEFNYSLSVFLSEIPLANMVFGLAKSLMMQTDIGDHSKLWFSDSDIWSVLNYLGIKCDSQHASNIVETYKNNEIPLLLSILKCVPFYRQDVPHDRGNTSMETLTSEKSSESSADKGERSPKGRLEKCKHYAHCKSCQNKVRGAKEKYSKKKKNLSKNYSPPYAVKVDNIMKNVTLTEKCLVDEMFHQLKSVYETEVEMVKNEEEKKYKQALSSYVAQLQKRQNEMEETYKQRETELESSVRQKKQFLWGLARALRDQHHNMAAAVGCVRGESQRLTAKEDDIKSQLLEAENVIKTRGEEMRAQISSEILILERHLETMKKERVTIDKERSELEKFKILCESKSKIVNEDSRFDMLKKEIVTLKKYVEGRKLCIAEKCTMTELESGGRMNNEEVGVKDGEDRMGRAPNQVVNDLKKQKNVNFNQSHPDTYQESGRSRIRSHSTQGFEERDSRRDTIAVLQDENERLKHFARQQEQHIDELNLQSARLQAELGALHHRALRPRTAPPSTTNQCFENRLIAPTTAMYAATAAGEHHCGTHHSDHGRDDSRRHLIKQWRALRRASPSSVQRQSHPHPGRRVIAKANPPSGSHNVDMEPMRETEHSYYEREEPAQNRSRPTPASFSEDPVRCKSLKCMLKEAKIRLKTKDVPKNSAHIKRDKSPDSTLREAKIRLKKLEIEAEAVEKSYLDFRKRQTMREDSRSRLDCAHDNKINDDVNHSRTFNETHRHIVNAISTCNENRDNLQMYKKEIDKLLNKYDNKFNVADSRFSSKASSDKARVIPQSILQMDRENSRKDTYLETPLTEFRKLYSQKSATIDVDQTKPLKVNPTRIIDKGETVDRNETNVRRKTHLRDEKKELQILKDNINKIYNLEEPDQSKDEEIKSEHHNLDTNMLRIEIESVTESNNLKLKECDAQDLLLVVQSSVESRNISNSDVDSETRPQMTVIVSPKSKDIRDETESISQDRIMNIPIRETQGTNVDNIHTDHVSPRLQKGFSDPLQEEYASDQDKIDDDYVDDFSADVDNYNSRSEYGDLSPPSNLKTSEDENFWDN